ncbi:hypothetical protein KW787_03110 [Candidatus Pacearchaeota archaeon]|nr:hypothetical protein [Candidatus Pacearchaeota archaeon]
MKKGLSDVVTTVLIILLVLAAVVIVWAFVRPFLQDAGGKITAACIQLDLQPLSCENWTSTSLVKFANVTYRWNAGDVNLSSVRIIHLDSTKLSAINATGSVPGLLGTARSTTNLVSFVPAQVQVAGIVRAESGQLITCPESKPISCVSS